MGSANRLSRQRLARSVRRDEAGFTIIETVIAMCVAMVIGFGSISLFIFSINYNAGAGERARAAALAQQRIEALRATPYADLANGVSTETVHLGSSAANQIDRRAFTVTTKIEDAAGVSNSRQKKITLTVEPDVSGRWSSGAVRLITYRSSMELGDIP